MKLLPALLLFLCAAVCAGETFRIKALTPRDSVCWGACFAISENSVVTCWHIIRDDGSEGKALPCPQIFVEVDGEWRLATVQKYSADVAILHVDAPRRFQPFKLRSKALSVVASAEGGPLKTSPAKPCNDFVIQGQFADGQSGGVVLDQNGDVVGMLSAVEPGLHPQKAYCISVEDIIEISSKL